MNISLTASLLETNDQFKIGIIHYTKITIAESPQMIKGRTRLYQDNLFFELQETPATKRPGISEWRTLASSFGIDPNRYQHSTERLMNLISKHNYIEPVNSAVDLNTFFSLQYEIPIEIYDVSTLQGNIEFAVGNEFVPSKNIIYVKDDNGPLGSPFVQSLRTTVTEETTDSIQLFYLRPSLPEHECNQLLQSAGKMFCQIHGGHFEIALLTKNNKCIKVCI